MRAMASGKEEGVKRRKMVKAMEMKMRAYAKERVLAVLKQERRVPPLYFAITAIVRRSNRFYKWRIESLLEAWTPLLLCKRERESAKCFHTIHVC